VDRGDEAILDQHNGLMDAFERSEQDSRGYRNHAKRTTILNGKMHNVRATGPPGTQSWQ
jgi:hypothetical protein